MLVDHIAYVVSALIGVGIFAVGVRFLLAPRAAAAGYGVAVSQDAGGADAYLAVKGVRDIGSGLVIGVVLALGTPHVLGAMMAAFAFIPIGDAVIVARRGRSLAVALGVHAATAAVMLAAAGVLLR